MSQRVALVTGGSQGIGLAICRSLAESKHHVIVASRSSDRVASVAESLRGAGYSASHLTLDVGDSDSFKGHIKALVAEFGGLHVLVNNAGITADNLMMRLSPDAFDSVITTNLRGAFFLSQAVLRPMMKQRFGRIINISSVVGLMGNAGQTNYAASKAGMIGMTKALAKEIGSRGITVNAIAPGYIETDMTQELSEDIQKKFLESVPLKRFGTPEEVAKVVSFMASDDASYITGQVVTVDGGLYM